MNFKKNFADKSPGFQMAPMLDIVFILLIQFMAATLYAKWEKKLDVKIPTADTRKTAERSRMEIIVNIDKDGAFFINSIKMDEKRLKSILGTVRSRSADQPVIIRADEETHHKDVVKVMAICAQLDIRNVAIAVIKAGAQGANQ